MLKLNRDQHRWNVFLCSFAPLRALSFVLVLLFSVTVYSTPSSACCFSCAESDCDQATDFIEQAHEDIREHTKEQFNDDRDAYQDWWLDIMHAGEFMPAMQLMATQMSAVAMSYTEIIGSFLDAQTQMDTQRLLRELQYEAHQDYRPSETFCTFGTNVRSLAATRTKARHNAMALSRTNFERQLGSVNVAGAENITEDYSARWAQFITTYCDYRDNNYLPRSTHPANTGLNLACAHTDSSGTTIIGGQDPNRFNRDIDYTRLIDNPRTLEVNFFNASLDATNPLLAVTPGVNQPGEEEDVIALGRNLYGSSVLSRALSQSRLQEDSAKRLYIGLRSVVAKRGVAQASYNAIVGLKATGTSDEFGMDPNGTPHAPVPHPASLLAGGTPAVLQASKQSRRFMASIMQQLLPASPSLTAGNIFSLIGYSPSYYSQLEILAKRIYQNPDFYADLYDTPVNVSRKKVAMKAIELMVDREIYESQLRREMSISVLLASKVRSSHKAANRAVGVGESKNK